jgi:hypothetical protein
MKATRAQIAKIHIAKKELRLDESDYRNAVRFYGVEHANDLDYSEAEELLNKFQDAGFKEQSNVKRETSNKKNWGKLKYTELDSRGYPFAKSSKLRKIEVLWREVSNSKTDESLQLFIKNRTGVDHITFLHNNHAHIIISALEAMGEKVKSEVKAK